MSKMKTAYTANAKIRQRKQLAKANLNNLAGHKVVAKDEWWNSLSKEEKQNYIKQHPNSKYAKRASSGKSNLPAKSGNGTIDVKAMTAKGSEARKSASTALSKNETTAVSAISALPKEAHGLASQAIGEAKSGKKLSGAAKFGLVSLAVAGMAAAGAVVFPGFGAVAGVAATSLILNNADTIAEYAGDIADTVKDTGGDIAKAVVGGVKKFIDTGDFDTSQIKTSAAELAKDWNRMTQDVGTNVKRAFQDIGLEVDYQTSDKNLWDKAKYLAEKGSNSANRAVEDGKLGLDRAVEDNIDTINGIKAKGNELLKNFDDNVNKINDGVSAVGQGIANKGDAVYDRMQKLDNLHEDIVNPIGDGVNAVGRGIKQGADAVTDTLNDVGTGFKKFFLPKESDGMEQKRPLYTGSATLRAHPELSFSFRAMFESDKTLKNLYRQLDNLKKQRKAKLAEIKLRVKETEDKIKKRKAELRQHAALAVEASYVVTAGQMPSWWVRMSDNQRGQYIKENPGSVAVKERWQVKLDGKKKSKSSGNGGGSHAPEKVQRAGQAVAKHSQVAGSVVAQHTDAATKNTVFGAVKSLMNGEALNGDQKKSLFKTALVGVSIAAGMAGASVGMPYLGAVVSLVGNNVEPFVTQLGEGLKEVGSDAMTSFDKVASTATDTATKFVNDNAGSINKLQDSEMAASIRQHYGSMTTSLQEAGGKAEAIAADHVKNFGAMADQAWDKASASAKSIAVDAEHAVKDVSEDARHAANEGVKSVKRAVEDTFNPADNALEKVGRGAKRLAEDSVDTVRHLDNKATNDLIHGVKKAKQLVESKVVNDPLSVIAVKPVENIPATASVVGNKQGNLRGLFRK